MCDLHSAVITLVTLACVITTIVIFGNSFILWKLNPCALRDQEYWRDPRRKRKRTNFDILLSYLSAFDLFAAVTMVPRIYGEISCYSSWPLGKIGCKVVLPLYDISVNISVCMLVIISIERYRKITMPFKNFNTQKSMHLPVIFSVLLSFAAYFDRFLTADNINGHCIFYRDTSLLNISPLLILLSRDIILLAVFTTTSVLIHRFLTSQARRNKATKGKLAQTKSVFTMLFRMQVVFTVLVLPYDLMSCISLSYVMINKKNLPMGNETFNLLSGYLYLLQMSNSLANCFIHSQIHRLVDRTNIIFISFKTKSLGIRQREIQCMGKPCIANDNDSVEAPEENLLKRIRNKIVNV